MTGLDGVDETRPLRVGCARGGVFGRFPLAGPSSPSVSWSDEGRAADVRRFLLGTTPLPGGPAFALRHSAAAGKTLRCSQD